MRRWRVEPPPQAHDDKEGGGAKTRRTPAMRMATTTPQTRKTPSLPRVVYAQHRVKFLLIIIFLNPPPSSSVIFIGRARAGPTAAGRSAFRRARRDAQAAASSARVCGCRCVRLVQTRRDGRRRCRGIPARPIHHPRDVHRLCVVDAVGPISVDVWAAAPGSSTRGWRKRR